MARSDVAIFAEGVIDLFGAPKPPHGSRLDEESYGEKWLDDLIDDLGMFNADTLERARKILRQTTKYKSMPNNAEIIMAAKEAVRQLEIEKPRLIRSEEKSREQISQEQRENNAIMLMRCHLGKQSCDEGWHGSLFDFVRDTGTLPRSGAEIEKLIHEARETDKTIKKISEIELDMNDTLTVMNRRFAQSVLGRRDCIRRAVLNGEVYNWGQP